MTASGTWWQRTWDGSTHRLYVDGVLDGTGTPATSTHAGHPVLIGAAVTDFFDGQIDELTIYEYALDGSEILGLFKLADSDGDGVIDVSDNCPAVENPEQADADGDGIGDPCDPSPLPNNAPEAQAGGPYAGLEGSPIPFDGTGSTDPDSDALTYEWDFGDSTPVSDEISPSHTYANNDVYDVTLTVTDPLGLSHSNSTTATISNVAPSVTAPIVTVFNEGGALSGTGSFIDPGADVWMGTVDYGDGSEVEALTVAQSLKTFELLHTYTNDGIYPVMVTISDADDSGTASGNVTVLNVIPTVVVTPPETTITEGDTFTGEGSFTDPGADTWTASVDYGDGATDSPTITGTSFALTHVYSAPGEYTVSASVTDDDGVGSTTVSVTVLSLQQATEQISQTVEDLVSGGTLNNGEGNSLDSSLDAAVRSMDRGNANAARNQLRAFINKVEAMEQSGRLTPQQAGDLTAATNALIAKL